MPQNVALFALGLLLLVVGAGVLARGAGRVARALGASPCLVGPAVAAFGTAAPVFLVSLTGAIHGSPQIALGAVLGSNVANIGLVLGLAALVRPLAARGPTPRLQLPLVIAATLLVWFLCRDTTLSRGDGAVLLAAFAAVCLLTYRTARNESAEVMPATEAVAASQMRVGVAGGFVAAGLAGLIGGAHLLVVSAVGIASGASVSEWVIAVAVIAVGTSLPGVVTCVAASRRGDADLVLGAVAWGNLCNVLLSLGVAVSVAPTRLSNAAVMNELPAIALSSLLLLVTIANGMRVYRWEGAVLVATYAGFLAWQVAAH